MLIKHFIERNCLCDNNLTFGQRNYPVLFFNWLPFVVTHMLYFYDFLLLLTDYVLFFNIFVLFLFREMFVYS